MPVSYLSKPVETSPYILPVDLNLLAKVDSYKQSMFYQNAQKVQDQLGALSNLDIANPVQKQYLTDAINSVTKKINDNFGIDYSDLNVTHSIENMGNEITGDENIENGIVSTKKIRTIQENYQKMANDPKLNKYYSQAYETYDYEHYIKPYINSDNLKASYNGPTNPTIYTGNPLEKAAKLIKQAHPEITQEIVNGKSTGGYVNMQTKERYTPEQLSNTFDSLLDGATKNELVKNAWYTLDYSNRKPDGSPVYDEDGYVGMLNSQSQTQLDNMESELKAQNQMVLTAGLDNDAKQAAQARAQQLSGQIDSFKQARGSNEAAFRSTFKKDKDSALYQLYVNGIKHDMYNIFGAEQTKVVAKADLNQLYEHQKEIAYIHKGLKYNGLNPDGSDNITPLGSPKAAKNADGAISGFTAVQANVDNTDEANKHAVTTESIKTTNQQLNNDVSQKFMDYVRNEALADKNNGVGNLFEALGFSTQTNSVNANAAANTTSSKILTNLTNLDKSTGTNVLDINDIRGATTDRTTGAKYGLNSKAYDYLQGLVASYDKITKNVDYDKPIPQKFKEFVDSYEDKMSLIKANNNLLQNTKNKALAEAQSKLTPTEVTKLNNYLSNPNAKDDNGNYLYKTIDLVNGPSYGTGYTPNPEIAKILQKSKLGNVETLDNAVDKKLANVSSRDNYLKIYFDNAQNEKALKEIIPGLTPYIYGENKAQLEGEKVNPDDVHPLNIYYSPTGWKLAYNVTAGGKSYSSDEKGTGSLKLKDLPLTEVQAQQLGAQSLPYPEFEKAASLDGEAEKKYVVPTFYNVKSDGTVANNAAPVQIRVFTSSNDRNNRTYQAQVWSPKLNRYETIPYEPGDEKYAVSANGAYMYAAKLLDSYANINAAGIGTVVTKPDGTSITVKNIDTFIENYIRPRQNAGY